MGQVVFKGYYKSIFFEFALQDRVADAIIILLEFPTKNEHEELIKLFYDRGYNVFVPFYRGSYQSGGVFLSKNPIDDLISFMKNLEKGSVKELDNMKKMSFKTNKKLLIGNSFGGAVACGLVAKYPVFSHLILVSPIWDFQKLNEKGDEINLNNLGLLVKRAYKNCYRFEFKDLIKKLNKFPELKPEYYLEHLQKIPVLVFHDPNDKIVSFRHTKEMMEKIPKINLIEHYFGHGTLETCIRAYWKEFDKFVKVNYIE